jgi:hypothetical protein
MRESSSNLVPSNSQKLNKIQEGDKKVMKKSLSLILALTMVFTMFASVAFAADPATTTEPTATVTGTTYTPQEAFDALVKAGIVVGDDVKGANLDGNLTRAEFSKILVNIFELKEDTAGSTVYTDLVGASWAKGYIGAATKAGLLNGMGGGKFNPSGNVKLEEIATVISKAFKLDISVAYAGAGKVDKWAKGYVAAVIKANLVADSADFTKAAKRSEIFTISLKGYTAYQLSKAPAPTPTPTPTPAVAVDVATVSALSSTVVKVALKTATTAANVANIAGLITVKETASGTAVAVKSASLYAEKELRVVTAATKGKTKYTLTYNGKTYNYIGIDADTTAPKVIGTAVAKTNTTVDVTFNEVLDKASAQTVTNYTIDNGLTVSKAELLTGDKVVRITTTSQTAGKLYTITVANTTDLSGNAVDTSNKTAKFGGLAVDTVAPALTATGIAQTNTSVLVIFSEEVDKATAETVANYSIDNGLTVTAAALVATDDLTYGLTYGVKAVYLTTSSQTAGKLYTVTVANVKDLSGNAVDSSNKTAKFGGIAPDTTAPKVTTTAIARSNTTVTVSFDEKLDKATAETAANYAIVDTSSAVLAVTNAELQTGSTSVKLTVAAQTAGKLYTITVSNVKDASGNVVDSSNKTAKFGGVALDTVGPAVTTAYGTVASDGTSYVTVTFDKALDSVSSLIPANYAFDKDLGYALDVTSINDNTVKLTTNTQSFNTLYKLTVSDVFSADMVLVKSDANTVTFAGVGADVKPEITAAVSTNIRKIVVYFNTTLTEAAAELASNWTVIKAGGSTDLVTTSPVYDNDAKTVTLYLNNDLEAGVLYNVTATNSVVNARGTAQTDATKLTTQAAGVTNAFAFNIDYILPVDNKTIDIYFNDAVTGLPVEADTYISGGVAATADANLNGSAVGANGTITAVSNSKVARLTLASGTTFVAGRVYSLYFYNGSNLVVTSAGGVPIKEASAEKSETFQFAGSGVTVSTPSIDSALAVDSKTLKVTFVTPVSGLTNADAVTPANVSLLASATGDANYSSTVNSTPVRIEAVKPEADNKEYYFYFANAFTAGHLYEITITNASGTTNAGGVIPSTTAVKGTFAGSGTTHAVPAIASLDLDNARTTLTVKFNQKVTASDAASTLFSISDALFEDGTSATLPGTTVTYTDADSATVTFTQALRAGTTGKLGLANAGEFADRNNSVNIITPAADMTQFSVPADTSAPTATVTDAVYSAGTITLTGTLFTTTAVALTDIKSYVDWSKFVVTAVNDASATTAITFSASDIASATVTNGTTITIVLTAAKAASVGTAIQTISTADKLTIGAGFLRDYAGNAATTDALPADGLDV